MRKQWTRYTPSPGNKKNGDKKSRYSKSEDKQHETHNIIETYKKHYCSISSPSIFSYYRWEGCMRTYRESSEKVVDTYRKNDMLGGLYSQLHGTF